MERIDGGSAFPVADRVIDNGPGFYKTTAPAQTGMSLRDYFAAKAMQGFCANPAQLVSMAAGEPFTRHAYKMADAMLKAREAKS